SVVCPVIDWIWCGVIPASARRREIALRNPCDEQSGRPAALQRSLIQLPKPAAVKGLPKLVTRNVFTPIIGVAPMIRRSSGCTGMVRVIGLRARFFCWV